MITTKSYFKISTFCSICTIWVTTIGITSCNNGPGTDAVAPPETVFEQPVTKPLKFSGSWKIDWAGIKPVDALPFVDKFEISKLPVKSYDTTGFRPVSKPVEKEKFDYNSLPEKDLDIDQLLSHKLKFKTYILPPPRMIKAGPAVIKNVNASVHQLAGIPELAGEHVSCLFTDRDGFLWIATLDGLYRYDGENLELFISIKLSQYVITMTQDDAGRIWMNEQQNGVDVLDIKRGIIKKTEHTNNNGLSGNDVVLLFKDPIGRIWLTFRKAGGVDIIDPVAETSRWLDKPNVISTAIKPRGIILDYDNNIWIPTLSGVNVIDLKNKKIKHLDTTNFLKTDSIISIVQDHEKRIWLGGYNGKLSIVDLKKGIIQHLKEKRVWILYVFNNMVWKVMDNGVEVADTKNNTALNLNVANGLDDASVEELGQDKQGQVWIGTDNGLNMISTDKSVFEHIGDGDVGTLAGDRNGLIWESTQKGVNIIDRKTKTYKNFTIHYGPDNDSVSTINELNNQIFICSRKGLDIIDSSRTTITHFGKEQNLSNKKTQAVVVDDKGRIWIGGREAGLDIYDPASKTIKHLGKTGGLSSNNIIDLKKDKRGQIWIATQDGGIDIIDPDTWIIKYISFAAGDKSLFADDEGNMWIGAKLYDNVNNGICIVNVKNQTLTFFSSMQGLIDDNVSSILEYHKRIYVGTVKGITVITPPATSIWAAGKWLVESYGKSYGLNRLNQEFLLTDMITMDGLYCWGDRGITVFDLSKKDTSQAKVFITGISVMDHSDFFTETGDYGIHDKDTLWSVDSDKYYVKGQPPQIAGYPHRGKLNWSKVAGPYNIPENWTLQHDQNFIRFTYSNLNLKDHDTTWYRYRLIGADKAWSDETTLNSTRNYFSLRPGNYTFEVSSRNADKPWNTPAVLDFTIKPPWWQTWWAYIIYVCLFAGSTWCFVYYRSRQLVIENRILEDKVNSRTEEVLQQKDEIFQQKKEIEAQRDGLES